MNDKVSFSKIACVGTGISGIGLGASLQRWYNETDIEFFERSSQPCGTWSANKYPGCACDVPSVLYSYSYEPNPDWTRVLPTNSEIEKYLRRIIDKYHLWPRMHFRVEVKECRWIEKLQRWRLYLYHGDDDRHSIHECLVLFSASGVLVYPRDLDIPGVEKFKGEIFHTAQWKQDADLDNKDIVIIGNGCTAAQVVPAIVDKVKHLTQFIRSKHWIFGQVDAEYPAWISWVFRNIPFALQLHRFQIFYGAEKDFLLFRNSPRAAKMRAQKRVEVEAHMRSVAPSKCHDLLIPDFEVGCKRRIYDPGYLKTAKITDITEDGIQTDDGFVKADIIILANGFKTNQFTSPLVIRGRGGVTLTDHWNEFDGPEAYHGSVMHGFPNFFMILGPNTVTGHTSAIMASENTINFALRVLKPFFKGKASTVEIKRGAEIGQALQIQKDLQQTVWHTGCNSWYVHVDKVTGKTWNALAYPYSQFYFWWRSVFPIWKDWQITPPTSKAPTGRLISSIGLGIGASVLALVLTGRGHGILGALMFAKETSYETVQIVTLLIARTLGAIGFT